MLYIYDVPCKDCERSYIGDTERNLQIRLTEHKAAVRRGDRKNGIAVHVQDHDHCVDWEAARVVGQEPHYILEKKKSITKRQYQQCGEGHHWS